MTSIPPDWWVNFAAKLMLLVAGYICCGEERKPMIEAPKHLEEPQQRCIPLAREVENQDDTDWELIPEAEEPDTFGLFARSIGPI